MSKISKIKTITDTTKDSFDIKVNKAIKEIKEVNEYYVEDIKFFVRQKGAFTRYFTAIITIGKVGI